MSATDKTFGRSGRNRPRRCATSKLSGLLTSELPHRPTCLRLLGNTAVVLRPPESCTAGGPGSNPPSLERDRGSDNCQEVVERTTGVTKRHSHLGTHRGVKTVECPMSWLSEACGM